MVFLLSFIVSCTGGFESFEEINMSFNVYEAVRSGDVNLLEKLIARGNPTDIQDYKGWSALHVAALTNNLECMKLLVSNDPSIINQTALDGTTPVVLCAKKNHIDCLKYLLSERADPNLCDRNGKTALNLAFEYRNMDIVVELLKSNVDVNIGVHSHIYDAMRCDRPDVLHLLIEHGAYINEPMNNWPALHFAAKRGSIDCTKLLLKLGANPNASSKTEKYLPLHLALRENHIPVIQILLPVTDHETMNNSNESPFYFPIRNSNRTSFNMLIEAGYSLTKLYNAKIYYTLLQRMFLSLDNLVISPLAEFIFHGAPSDMCDIFLSNIFCYSSLSPNEFPPLLAALIMNNLPIASHLIKNGASINVYLSNYPFNMSLFACQSFEALELLLRLGVEVKSLLLDESVEVFIATFRNGKRNIRLHLERVICQSLHHHKMAPLPTKLKPHLSQKCLDILYQYPIVRSLKETCKRTIISSLHPEQIIDGLQCLKPLPNPFIDYLLHVDILDWSRERREAMEDDDDSNDDFN